MDIRHRQHRPIWACFSVPDLCHAGGISIFSSRATPQSLLGVKWNWREWYRFCQTSQVPFVMSSRKVT